MPGNNAIRPLTSLRFVAAAMIVLVHAVPSAKPGLQLPLLDNAVSFFFVLSGFVMAYNYPALAGWMEVRDFLILRIGRIWPAHLVTAIAAAIVFATFDGKIIANLAMVHAWIPVSSWYFSYNLVSWSISTEFFFYLAFPLLILNWRRAIWWKLCLSAVTVWFLMWASARLQLPTNSPDAASVHGVLYINPLARLLEFAAGMATCTLFQALRERGDRLPAWVFSLMEIGLAAVIIYVVASQVLTTFLAEFLPATAPVYLSHASAWPLFALAILLVSFEKGWLARVLAMRPLVLLGEASYSLYLVHMLVIIVLLRILPARGWSFLAVAVAISQVVAFVLYYGVERPARGLVKRRLASGHARADRGGAVDAVASHRGSGAPETGPALNP